MLKMKRNRMPAVVLVITAFIFCSFFLLPSRDAPGSPMAGGKGGYSKAGSITVTDAQMAYKNVDESGFAIAKENEGPGSRWKVAKELLNGETIMPKLGNETIKAELGRASWKLLHTTLSRFPLKPSADERETLNSYLYLFARLYPCGECAAHFQALLKQYPPQTSSRDAAAQWGCYVHNKVNERLKKPIFDCGLVTEHYKCGCAESDAEELAPKITPAPPPNEVSIVGITSGRPLTAAEGVDLLEENTRGARVEVQRDGLMDGG